MRDALIADLAALGHRVVVSVDPRSPLRGPARRTAVRPPAPITRLIEEVDAVWLLAPETNRCHERLAALVERRGQRLLGSSSTAIRLAADKARLPALLRRAGVPHPSTRRLRNGATASLTFPVVVKPARGAGSQGVRLVPSRGQLPRDWSRAVLAQEFVAGIPASVSLLVSGRDAVVLAVNRQSMVARRPFSYRGGSTPFEHPLAARAAGHARRACLAIPGLRGYVGVDVVLGAHEAWVIEINPRLTTSYLGLRAAFDQNLADIALRACAGRLPHPRKPRRRVRFTASGRVRSADR